MERILEILNKIKPGINLDACNNLVEEGLLDSIDILSIVNEIENAYSITVDPVDIDPDNFQSPKTIYEMVRRIKDTGI